MEKGKTSSLRIFGTYGSPYTRKMLSLLRYRRIPYRFLPGDHNSLPRDLPKPRVALLPILYFEESGGESEAVVDSTPVIRRLEEAVTSRSVLPPDPALRFLDYLLEDFADEWLTKAMFHYRWSKQTDADKSSALLPLEHNPALGESLGNTAREAFRARQVSRLHVVGSSELTSQIIEDSYMELLRAFDGLLKDRPFLFGRRPAAADFAFYGQLSQLASFDPTPLQLALQVAPRVCAWVNYMDDLSGLEISDEEWLGREEAHDLLLSLLTVVGHYYVPLMLANREALSQESKQVETLISGKRWEQLVFPYQGRCLRWVRDHYRALADSDRAWTEGVLSGAGCIALCNQ